MQNRWFSAVLIGSLLASCAHEPPVKTQLLLQLQTDLSAAEDLAFVEVQVLDVSGDNVHDSRWFSVAPSCFEHADGTRILGSMGLPKAQRDQARLQVIGYARDPDGSADRAVTARVDAAFKKDTILTVPILLASDCHRPEHDACNEDASCPPLGEECGTVADAVRSQKSTGSDKQHGDCLTELQEPPPLTDETDPEPFDSLPQCSSEDGECPDGCTPAIDTDCRKTRGEECAQANECRPGLSCAQGYCCNEPCTGACEQCDAAGHLGTCVAIDFSARDDAANCQVCGRVCSGTHAEPLCSAGECVGACEPGYGDCNENKQADGCETELGTPDNCSVCGHACSRANVAMPACVNRTCVPRCAEGFMDCNAQSGANDGCEQNIQDDAVHCGGCGDAYRCLYPLCHSRTCARVRGAGSATGSYLVPQFVILGGLVNLPSPAKLVGVGGLFENTSQPAATVRFAVYEARGDSAPGKRRAVPSGAAPVIDFVAPSGPDAALPYTIAPLTPVDLGAGDYWVMFIADKPIVAKTEADLYDVRWRGDSTGTVDFAASNPGGEFDVGVPRLDLALFVVEAL